MTRRPPARDDEWFRRKIRELGNALRELPRDRQEAAIDELEEGDLTPDANERVQ